MSNGGADSTPLNLTKTWRHGIWKQAQAPAANAFVRMWRDVCPAFQPELESGYNSFKLQGVKSYQRNVFCVLLALLVLVHGEWSLLGSSFFNFSLRATGRGSVPSSFAARSGPALLILARTAMYGIPRCLYAWSFIGRHGGTAGSTEGSEYAHVSSKYDGKWTV